MIRYTKSNKIMENFFRRLPVKRAHGKRIVFSGMNSKLGFEILERVKRM